MWGARSAATRALGLLLLAVPLGCAGCRSEDAPPDTPATASPDASAATTPSGDAAGGSDGQLDTAPEADVAASGDAADGAQPTPGDPCRNAGTEGATATCLSPTQTADYYAAEANRYFDTLDIAADPDSAPNYAPLVARWEWPPWLLLTGYGRQNMVETGKALKELDPSTVPERDCRFFPSQPFARCFVEFRYEGGPCPIYEEFTFNDAGEMTFIEAWSNVPGLLPAAMSTDRWAETADIGRLSTRIPGLGNPQGALDLGSTWMTEAAAQDADVADFVTRAGDFWRFWFQALGDSPKDYFATGCGW